MQMASLIVQHLDGRLVVLIYREDLHELPLYLMRGKGEFATTVLAAGSKHKVKRVMDDGLMEKLYPGAQMGTTIQTANVAEVKRYLGV
jgi:flagellar biosynthesis protein FlhB